MDTYDPTIENYYRKQVRVGDQVVVIEMLDTAGQEEYTSPTIVDNYLKSAEGFVVVYSTTSRKSFEKVNEFFDRITHIRGTTQFPSVIVANKADLMGKREVSTEEGQHLSKYLDFPIFETSAKDINSVSKMFSNIVEQVFKSYSNSASDSDSSGEKRKKKKEKCNIM